MSKPIETLEDLTPDARNANRGTERGRGLLETSLRQYGAGRSILADKHGVVIAGNKTLEVAADLGLPVKVVATDGRELVVVQRTDLDLERDPAARELAYADNRVGQVDLDFDPVQISADWQAGVNLDGLFTAQELDVLLEGLPEVETDSLNEAPALERADPQPVIHYDLIFDNGDQQARWHAFLRFLKARSPASETIAARLDAFLRETVEGLA